MHTAPGPSRPVCRMQYGRDRPTPELDESRVRRQHHACVPTLAWSACRFKPYLGPATGCSAALNAPEFRVRAHAARGKHFPLSSSSLRIMPETSVLRHHRRRSLVIVKTRVDGKRASAEESRAGTSAATLESLLQVIKNPRRSRKLTAMRTNEWAQETNCAETLRPPTARPSRSRDPPGPGFVSTAMPPSQTGKHTADTKC